MVSSPSRSSSHRRADVADTRHPRDRFVTVYGRRPVIEALHDASLTIDKVVMARGSIGDSVDEIRALAHDRGIPIEAATVEHVTKLARNGKQHQGVVVDIVAPRMQQLASWLDSQPAADATVLLLDNVANPANVGMIIRSATAAGIDGVVLPRQGSPDLTPVVIKASAGVALNAPIFRCETPTAALAALRNAGFHLFALTATGTSSIYDAFPSGRVALVVGNESEGLSAPVREQLGAEGTLRAIPMAASTESLNVACAASVAMFELGRQRSAR
jgi:23S rRNA (guanosine2251-2'-O)-methyltransferase